MQFLCLSVSSLIPAVRVLFCINGLAYLPVRGTLLCISWPSSTASGAEKLLLVFIGLCSFVSHSLQHCSHVIHPSLARKRTGDAEIGWRPAPEKNIEAMPCWGKNSPENCLVDLGRDTRTSTQSRRLVRRKGASWSLHWPSGVNLLVHLLLKCILNVPL